jgi:hypothetical protein
MTYKADYERSWIDRIPFVLLFGVATSVELFQERLSKSATRCLFGIQVDIEQTSSVIERIFQKAVASSSAVLRLGPEVLSILMERQLDHLQSVQSFVSAIKVKSKRVMYLCYLLIALVYIHEPLLWKCLKRLVR